MGWTNLNAVSLPTGSILMEHAKTLEAAQEAVKKRKKQEDEAEPRKKKFAMLHLSRATHGKELSRKVSERLQEG